MRPTESAAAIESLFAQSVILAYNFAASIWLLLRSPVRGSMRLLVRNRSQTFPQLGPYTMLFILVGLTFFLLRTSVDRLPDSVRDLVIHRKTPIEIVVASFGTVLLIDAFMRLATRTFVRDPRRRQRLLITAMYAVCAHAAYVDVALAGGRWLALYF